MANYKKVLKKSMYFSSISIIVVVFFIISMIHYIIGFDALGFLLFDKSFLIERLPEKSQKTGAYLGLGFMALMFTINTVKS